MELPSGADLQKGADAPSSSSSSSSKRVKTDVSTKHLSEPQFLCFTLQPDGSVRCACKTTLLRPYRSDLDGHLGSKAHLTYEQSIKNIQKNVLNFSRPASQATNSPEKIFNYLHIAHLLSCNIPLSTPLFTPTYVAALQRFKIPGPRQTANLLPEAAEFFRSRLKEVVANKPFSLLVDETPLRDGVGFFSITVTTAERKGVLYCKKLGITDAMCGEHLAEIVQTSIASFLLRPSDFVALIEDNVKYGRTGFDILRQQYPHLERVGCISHTLSLMAKALSHKDLFPEANQLLQNLRAFFCDTRSKHDRALHESFQKFFGCSASVLDYVETRWSEWLSTLSWVLVHREKISEWISQEIDATKAKSLAAPTKKLRERYDRLGVNLATELASLTSVRTRVQLAIIDDLTLQIAKLIKLSQNSDSVQFSRHVHSLIDLVALMRTRSTDPASLKQYVTRILASEHLIVSGDYATAVGSALTNALLKFDSHSGMAVRYLLAIAILDCSYWSCGRPFPLEAPEAFHFLFTSRVEWNQVEMEWCAIGRCATLQKQQQLTERKEPSLLDTTLFWRQISREAPAPMFGTIVERVLSVRQGIGDVERSFSKLRSIDEVRRNRSLPETVEDEFWIAANSDLCTEFQNNHQE